MQPNRLTNIEAKSIYNKLLSLSILTILLTSSASSMAQGDLLLYPKRIVFDGTKRSQELNLSNTGKDTTKYIVSVVQIRMKEDGTFENISLPDSGQNFADKNFRFFPRNVVLAPNESQTVKIQLIKMDGMIPGEYRSHIYLRAEPEKKPLGYDDLQKDSTAISVRLTPVYGISIPVIIRVGGSTSKVSLSDLAFATVADSIPALKVKFHREGNMSVYGDISVDHIADDGKVTRVAMVQGVAVYAPTSSRQFQVLLNKNKGADFRSGKLHVAYSEQSPKGVKLAEEEIVIGQQLTASR